MRALVSTAILTIGLLASNSAMAEPGVRWLDNLDTAKLEASRANRLILLHFWNDGCPPCQKMDRDVFPRDDVAQAVSRNFVAVKLKVNDHKLLAETYNVEHWPADVILQPDGTRLGTMYGFQEAADYMGKLSYIAHQYPVQRADTRMASTTPPGAGYQPPTMSEPYSPGGYEPPSNRRTPAAGVAYEREQPSGSGEYAPPSMGMNRDYAPPMSGQERVAEHASSPVAAPPGNPPVGLGGYCPVWLTRHQEWRQGSPQWGVRHEGRTYFFTSDEAKREFFANPERYAPVASGNDIVLLTERNIRTPGQLHFGLWAGPGTQIAVGPPGAEDRVYLFASRETYERFRMNPDRYVLADGDRQTAARNNEPPRGGAPGAPQVPRW